MVEPSSEVAWTLSAMFHLLVLSELRTRKLGCKVRNTREFQILAISKVSSLLDRADGYCKPIYRLKKALHPSTISPAVIAHIVTFCPYQIQAMWSSCHGYKFWNTHLMKAMRTCFGPYWLVFLKINPRKLILSTGLAPSTVTTVSFRSMGDGAHSTKAVQISRSDS